VKVRSLTDPITGCWYTYFKDPIYGVYCYLVVGVSTEIELVNFCESVEIDVTDFELEYGEFAGACWGPEDGSSVVMALASFDSTDPHSIDTYCHELFHFTHTALSGRGIEHQNSRGCEAFAYYCGFVSGNFWRELTKE